MPRKKPNARKAESDGIHVTPNQVVAFNLAQARLWNDWTQAEAVEALEPHLGHRMSIASYSAAERSVDGSRVRKFSADEIYAFSKAFGLPVTFFFLPPPSHVDGVAVLVGAEGAESLAPAADMIDVVFGADDGSSAIAAIRMDRTLSDIDEQMMTRAQHALLQRANERTEAVARRSMRKIGSWTTNLRNIANQLEDIETRARRVVDDLHNDSDNDS